MKDLTYPGLREACPGDWATIYMRETRRRLEEARGRLGELSTVFYDNDGNPKCSQICEEDLKFLKQTISSMRKCIAGFTTELNEIDDWVIDKLDAIEKDRRQSEEYSHLSFGEYLRLTRKDGAKGA